MNQDQDLVAEFFDESIESLQHVAEIAVGNGVMKQHDQRSLLREWRKAAGMRPERVTVAPQNRGKLAQIGLGIKVADGGSGSRQSST